MHGHRDRLVAVDPAKDPHQAGCRCVVLESLLKGGVGQVGELELHAEIVQRRRDLHRAEVQRRAVDRRKCSGQHGGVLRQGVACVILGAGAQDLALTGHRPTAVAGTSRLNQDRRLRNEALRVAGALGGVAVDNVEFLGGAVVLHREVVDEAAVTGWYGQIAAEAVEADRVVVGRVGRGLDLIEARVSRQEVDALGDLDEPARLEGAEVGVANAFRAVIGHRNPTGFPQRSNPRHDGGVDAFTVDAYGLVGGRVAVAGAGAELADRQDVQEGGVVLSCLGPGRIDVAHPVVVRRHKASRRGHACVGEHAGGVAATRVAAHRELDLVT